MNNIYADVYAGAFNGIQIYNQNNNTNNFDYEKACETAKNFAEAVNIISINNDKIKNITIKEIITGMFATKLPYVGISDLVSMLITMIDSVQLIPEINTNTNGFTS